MPALGKTLLQLAEVVDGAIVVALQQVHVSGGKQRLFQPRARRTKLPELVESSLHGFFIARGTGGLAQQVEALGFGVARLRSHGSQKLAGIVTAIGLFKRTGQGQLHFRTVRRRDFFDQIVVIMGRVGIVFGFEQEIGARAALRDRAGNSELVQFRSRHIRLETGGKVVVKVAESARGLLSVARSFVGAPNGEFHIGAHWSAVFFQQIRCFLRPAFLEQRARIDEMGIAD